MKKALATLLIASMAIASLAACGGTTTSGTGTTETAVEESALVESNTDTSVSQDTKAETSAADSSVAEEAEEENYETGDASLDNPRNQDDIGENELLVVSFGTSFNDNRRNTIGAIENALEKAFPDWSVRRAFTSQIIIDHVKSRDGEEIDNVKRRD